ncbi:MAG: sulfatase-like hydrolase/transferase [Pirellulaceae bacterium]|nr:sulfatase-like hydrolase/transferase [Pirellulaceae bacterium]
MLTFQATSWSEEKPRSAHPNIIMVFIDDMGWGDFSCFGNKDAQTPNIDRLAAEGIRFSQFYVNAPICSPSRCALTTGQYPHRWRITSFLNNRGDNERRGVAQWLDPKAPTLARFLHQSGYATGHFGKWHLGGQRDVDDAPAIAEYGFDESLTNFEGMGPKLLPLTLKPGDKEPGKIWADAERLGQPVTWMQRSEITSGFIDKAIPFIDKATQEKKPFYVNLWPDDVHGPWWPPLDKWADGKRGLYLSVLQEMDLQFGKLFDHVRDTPSLRDNTLILVCSDNGPELGAGSAGPFRGGKTMLYEGGIRSSLIAWGPGLINHGKTGSHNESSVFCALDLVPSLLSIAHVEQPKGVAFDGENLARVLVGESTASRSEPICWRRPPDRPTWAPSANVVEALPDLAIRDGDWKLLCSYDGSLPLLYDLSSDRSETTNVVNQHPEVVMRLTKRILEWHLAMPPDLGPELGAEAAAKSNNGKAKGGKGNKSKKK